MNIGNRAQARCAAPTKLLDDAVVRDGLTDH
jgi:hypothetical protein